MTTKTKNKYCGNCDAHNCYIYPSKIFCSTRYEQNLDPIVDTLWCCIHWNEVTKECYCVKEALKNKKQNKEAQH